MKLTRIIVLTLALVAGLSAAWLAKGVFAEKKQVKTAAPKVETVKVLTASADISLGNVLKAKSLKWQEWPKSAISAHLVTNKNEPGAIKKFTGATVRAPFVTGEPILARKLVINNQGGVMSAILPAGMRATSTKISPETGAGGFILPNDRVDVILTRQEPGARGTTKYFSETILTNVRVLAIDQTIEDKESKDAKGKSAVGKTATLELTSEQTEVLALSEKRGSLSLALRSLVDSRPGANKPEFADSSRRRGRNGSVTVLRYGASYSANPKR